MIEPCLEQAPQIIIWRTQIQEFEEISRYLLLPTLPIIYLLLHLKPPDVIPHALLPRGSASSWRPCLLHT